MIPDTLSDLRILSIGNDDQLLWIRELVLKQTGYTVYSTPAAELAARNIEFDVVVLCRTIAIEAAEALARTMKAERPSTPIVRLSPRSTAYDRYFDAVCDPTSGPVELLQQLARLRAILPRGGVENRIAPAGTSPQDTNPCRLRSRLRLALPQTTCCPGPVHSTKSTCSG